jgi:magnesium transporter
MQEQENQSEDSRVEYLQQLIDDGTFRKASRLLAALATGEVANLLESVPPPQRQVIWKLIDEEVGGDVLMELTDEVRADLLNNMDSAEVVAVSESLDTDDLVDLIQQLPHTITREIIESLDGQHRERLEAALSYPEDTAGGLMNPDVVTVRPEVTVDVVVRYLRRIREQLSPRTDILMVVNRQGKYLGVLPLTDLVIADAEETVAEVMTLDFNALPASIDEREVASRFEQHDLVSAPVIDDEGYLLGVITIDDVVDVIREEGEHQFMGSAGLSEEEDMFAPIMTSARRRAFWLGINLITAFLASWVIGLFEATIQQIVALAVLMPIVASMGGIAGTQTLTLTIRGIALNQLNDKNARWLLGKELAVGALNGVVWAVIVGIIAGIWFKSIDISILIGTAITINLLFAAVTGALLPRLLDRVGIDPALAGGVLLTTVTDVVGFMAFLGLATLFML